jgi:hypothetical protein
MILNQQKLNQKKEVINMCGIVGALTFDAFEKKSEEKIRTESDIYITTQLLQATVERGKDATGVFLSWADGNYTGLKMGIPSPEFIARFGETEKDFKGFLKIWRTYPKLMKVFIGHCRKSSIGNSYDNKNNHPIQIGDMVLVHNGTLTNHETIFDKLDCDRTGDVDSEAIGRLLHHYTAGGTEPFTTEIIKETTRRLHGTYSVLAMSGNNPFQVAQFRDGRTAEMVLVKPLKTVYIASEKKFLENVLFEYNKASQLFSMGDNFPYLKAGDVEFETLPDDSLALWDLTLPITPDTSIKDLYDYEKTPMRVDKIWSATTTTSYNTGTTAKKTAGTEVIATSKKTGSTTAGDDDANGLVWSRSMNKYKTQQGISETKEYGAVTVDVDDGSITPVADSSTPLPSGDDVTEVSADAVENLITGAAEIKEVGIKRTEDATNSVADDAKKNSINKETPSVPSGATIEVDMTSDPEAIKKANIFIEKGLTKYENDNEVADDIEVSDAAVLRPLPMFALANRIKGVIFRQGFIVGWQTHKAEGKQPDAAEILEGKKAKNAEKKIRIMKAVIKVLAFCLKNRTKGNSRASVIMMLNAALQSNTKTAHIDLSSAFSVGDLKNIPMLKELKSQMEK